MANIALITNNILSDSGTALTSVLSGSGTTNYLSKFTGSTALGNSLVYDDGTNIGIGTTNPTGQMSGTTGLGIFHASYPALGLRNASYQWLNYLDGSYYKLWNAGAGDVMSITYGGNVLIGTVTDNGAKLQVNGTGRFSGGIVSERTIDALSGLFLRSNIDGSSIFNNGIILGKSTSTNDAASIVYTHVSNGSSSNRLGLGFWNADNLLNLTASGNVGIGTSTPSDKLHISGNLRVTGTIIDSNNSPGTSGQVLSSTATGTDWVSLSEITGVDGTGTTNYVPKWLDANTIGNSLIYDNGTAVGIGTTSPLVALDVRGTVIITNQAGGNYNENLRLPESTSGYASLTLGGSIAASGTSAAQWTLVKFPTTNNFSIRNNNSDYVTVFPTGNLAIGNSTDAGYKLDVVNGAIRIVYSTFAGIEYHNTAGTWEGYIGTESGSGNLRYNSRQGAHTWYANSAANMTLTAAGNLGIGITSPAAKLDVNGVIRAGSASSVSGSNILWGNYGNGALTTFGSMYSDGGPVLGYAVSPSTSGSPAFLSSTGITIARGAYAISGATHYWFGGSSQTVAIGSSVSMSEFMRIASTGNLLVGTSTDSGYKLDINGTARINSTLALTSSTYAGTFSFYLSAANTLIGNSSNIGNWLQVGGGNRVYIIGQEFNSTSRGNIFGNTVGGEAISATTIIAQSSGTTDTAGLGLRYTINNTGTYSGVTRGIYYNPTVTSLTGTTHRAIETVVGDVIFNSTSGSVGIGTTSPAYKLQVAGDIGFTAGANRYIRLANPAASGSANHIIIQGASANTSGTGGNIYLYEGSGAGGPGPGSIYIGATTGWTTTYITGQATISSTGPNTGTVFQVNAGGQNGLTINWDNLTPYMGYGLVVNRQSRFYNSSSYTFDNNLIVGSNTNSGEKLQVNGSGNFNLGNSGYIKLQSGSGQRHGFIQSAYSNFLFSNNVYYDGSNWRYDQNGYGAQIQTETLSVGVIAFNTFASGTAGGVATIIESMRIVNNGNILMGTTSDSGHKLQVNGTSKFTNSIYLTGTNRFIASGSSSQSVALYGGSAYTDGAYFNVTGNTYGASPGGGSAEFVIRTNSDSKFAMFGYNGSSWSRYMTLFGPTGNMNIGYGTLDNGFKFTVQGDAYVEGNAYIMGTVTGVTALTTNNYVYANANESGGGIFVYADITSGPNNLYSGGQIKANIYSSSLLTPTTVVPSTSQVLMSWYPTTTQGVFIDYTLWIDGPDAMRSGTIMVVNDTSGNVQYTDTATIDLNASTSGVTLAAANNGGTMEVTLYNGTGNVAYINIITRYIPTMS